MLGLTIFDKFKIVVKNLKGAKVFLRTTCIDNWPVGRVLHVTTNVRLWNGRSEVQISGPAKSDTALPTARHRCDISKGAMLPVCNDTELSSTNSLHTSA